MKFRSTEVIFKLQGKKLLIVREFIPKLCSRVEQNNFICLAHEYGFRQYNLQQYKLLSKVSRATEN